MRKVFILVFVLACLSLTAASQTRERSVSAKPRTAEHEIRAVITNWARAVKNRDIEVLDRLFADDLFITDYGGATRGKREELEILKPSATMRTLSVTNEGIRVRTYPKSNAAIVTAIVRMMFRANGRDSPFAMRYTSFWEKRAGRWQLTVLHTTRLAAK